MTEGAPRHNPNGAEIIAAYADIEPDPEFASDFEAIREEMNRPVQVEDPWEPYANEED